MGWCTVAVTTKQGSSVTPRSPADQVSLGLERREGERETYSKVGKDGERTVLLIMEEETEKDIQGGKEERGKEDAI